jgi:heme/copper-type cytochrome/quinol oxidase subunit 1
LVSAVEYRPLLARWGVRHLFAWRHFRETNETAATFADSSPARLFAIVGAGVFVITFLTDLHKIAGTPALDLARGDEAVFNVSHLYVLDPLFFALSAGLYTLYARVCGRQLNRLLVSVHFWTSLAFISFVIYLALIRVDLVPPDWLQEFGSHFEMQARVFIGTRIIFGLAQIIFLVNLLWSGFFGRKIQTQTT